MKQCRSLPAAIVGLWAIAFCVGACPAQIASVQAGTRSGEETQPVTPSSAGALRWTAGAASFNQANRGNWSGSSISVGTAGTSWTAAPDAFAERAQAQGIWRESPPAVVSAAGKPAAAQSLQPASASAVFAGRTPARPGTSGVKIAHSSSAAPTHRTLSHPPARRKLATQRGLNSRPDAGVMRDSIPAPSLRPMTAPSPSLNDRIGSGRN